MLIDSGHKKWAYATLTASAAALALYWWVDRRAPDGLTGGSTAGLWFGVAGSLLMVYAGLLSALRKVPSWWWLGSRTVWLKGHIWLGSLSGVFLLCHSGFRWGGPLERLLWLVLAATLLTGALGLALQQFLPRMITTRVPREAPYGQIPHLCRKLHQQAAAVMDEVVNEAPGTDGQNTLADHSELGLGARAKLVTFYQAQVRPLLGERYDRRLALADPLKAEASFSSLRQLPGLATAGKQIDELESLCEERRQLGEEERLYGYLHGWLLLHVPLSALLLVLGVAHAVMSLYY